MYLIKKMSPLEKNTITETDKLRELTPTQVNIFDFIEDNTLVEAKDRESEIEAGYKCTLFNIYQKEKEYDLNYKYYFNEINKLIKPIIQ